MSIGAGSIKRAANAANAINTGNSASLAETKVRDTEGMAENTTRAESIIQKAESRLAARKAGEGKPMNQRTATPPTGKGQMSDKTAANKSKTEGRADVTPEEVKTTPVLELPEEKIVIEEQSGVSESEGHEIGKYVIYGIGQELPIYLL